MRLTLLFIFVCTQLLPPQMAGAQTLVNARNADFGRCKLAEGSPAVTDISSFMDALNTNFNGCIPMMATNRPSGPMSMVMMDPSRILAQEADGCQSCVMRTSQPVPLTDDLRLRISQASIGQVKSEVQGTANQLLVQAYFVGGSAYGAPLTDLMSNVYRAPLAPAPAELDPDVRAAVARMSPSERQAWDQSQRNSPLSQFRSSSAVTVGQGIDNPQVQRALESNPSSFDATPQIVPHLLTGEDLSLRNCVTEAEFLNFRSLPQDDSFYMNLQGLSQYNRDDWDIEKLRSQVSSQAALANPEYAGAIASRISFLIRNPMIRTLFSLNTQDPTLANRESLRAQQEILFRTVKLLTPTQHLCGETMDSNNGIGFCRRTISPEAFRNYREGLQNIFAENSAVKEAILASARRDYEKDSNTLTTRATGVIPQNIQQMSPQEASNALLTLANSGKGPELPHDLDGLAAFTNHVDPEGPALQLCIRDQQLAHCSTKLRLYCQFVNQARAQALLQEAGNSSNNVISDGWQVDRSQYSAFRASVCEGERKNSRNPSQRSTFPQFVQNLCRQTPAECPTQGNTLDSAKRRVALDRFLRQYDQSVVSVTTAEGNEVEGFRRFLLYSPETPSSPEQQRVIADVASNLTPESSGASHQDMVFDPARLVRETSSNFNPDRVTQSPLVETPNASVSSRLNPAPVQRLAPMEPRSVNFPQPEMVPALANVPGLPILPPQVAAAVARAPEVQSVQKELSDTDAEKRTLESQIQGARADNQNSQIHDLERQLNLLESRNTSLEEAYRRAVALAAQRETSSASSVAANTQVPNSVARGMASSATPSPTSVPATSGLAPVSAPETQFVRAPGNFSAGQISSSSLGSSAAASGRTGSINRALLDVRNENFSQALNSSTTAGSIVITNPRSEESLGSSIGTVDSGGQVSVSPDGFRLLQRGGSTQLTGQDAEVIRQALGSSSAVRLTVKSGELTIECVLREMNGRFVVVPIERRATLQGLGNELRTAQ